MKEFNIYIYSVFGEIQMLGREGRVIVTLYDSTPPSLSSPTYFLLTITMPVMLWPRSPSSSGVGLLKTPPPSLLMMMMMMLFLLLSVLTIPTMGLAMPRKKKLALITGRYYCSLVPIILFAILGIISHLVFIF